MSGARPSPKDFVADLDALERLIDEHQLLKETIEHSPLPFAVYDRKDRLIAHNRAYERIHPELFGDAAEGGDWTYEDVVRKTLNGQVPEDDLEAEVAARVRAQRDADGRGVERFYADGGWMRVTKYRTPSGAIAGMALDVNDLKSREEELEVAWKAARIADKAKSEFLANMSHEIRTPMNGVIGMAELMAKTELTERQRMFNEVIISSGRALLKVINDVLDYSKIEAHQMVLEAKPFDLTDAVETAATLFSAEIAAKGVELVVRVHPDLPRHVVGDAGRLRQVLTNLIGNAAKFTEEGHIFVNVEKCDRSKDGFVTVLFKIEDTGPGIPPSHCERIFAKFTQVDGSNSRAHQGTGLGLSIASSLVELMRGEIGVDSQVGHGATFRARISFPIAETEATRCSAPSSQIEGARVLIVDDSRVNRTILSELAASWKLRPYAAASGEEGLAELEDASVGSDPYDAVILDYHMPGMGGEDVLAAIGEDPAFSGLPVIFLTSVDCAPFAASARRANLVECLTKPVKSSDLLNVLSAALSETLGARRGAAAAEGDSGSGGVAAPPCGKTAQEGEVDVLIAEDAEVGQMVMSQIVEAAGLTSRVVANGKLAVAAHRLHRPKVVLMDVAMPEMNGLEATRQIRRAERASGRRTPIIGVTAHALAGDRETCLAAGMDDYVTKPISPDHLMTTIERWMRQDA